MTMPGNDSLWRKADVALVVETRTRDRFNFRYTANKEIDADASEVSNVTCIAPRKYAIDENGFDLSTG